MSRITTIEKNSSIILSGLILLYIFSPIRLKSDFIFQNQIELITVVMALSLIGCTWILIKNVYISRRLKTFIWLDLSIFLYLIYLLFQLIFYPVDKEYILTIACLSVTYFLFRHIPKQLFTGLLYLLPLLVVVQIIYSYNRLTAPWQGLSDITGTFDNTGIFGGFVAMGFITTIGLMLSAKRLIIRIALCILFIPLIIQLLYSQSRAAWVAAVAGTLVLLLPFFRKVPKLKATILVLALFITGILFSTKLYHFKKDSADGRLLMWTISWNMIKEKPLTGLGPSGFQKNYPLCQGEYFKNHPDSPWADLAGDTSSPFNEFLKIGVEQGIIGLLFIAGIIFLVFSNTTSPLVLRAILAALIAFSCFSYPFEFVSFQVLGIFCLAGIASFQKPTIGGIYYCESDNRKQSNCKFLKLLFVCLIIAIGGLSLFSSCEYYKNVKKWDHIIYSLSQKHDQKITELQALYPALKYNAWFVFTYAQAIYDAGHYPEAIPLLEEATKLYSNSQALLLLGESYEKTGAYVKALETWETASHIKPSLFTPHYNMARLYFKLKDCKRAKQKAGEVINKKMKIASPKIKRMKQEMQQIYICDN